MSVTYKSFLYDGKNINYIEWINVNLGKDDSESREGN